MEMQASRSQDVKTAFNRHSDLILHVQTIVLYLTKLYNVIILSSVELL